MIYNSEQLIILFTILPVLVAAFVAVTRYRFLAPPQQLIAILIGVALLTEIVSRVLWFYKLSNLFLWPVYITLEFSLLVWAYSLVLEWAALKRITPWIILAFATFLLFRYVIYTAAKGRIDNTGRIIESAVIVALVIAYYYKTITELKINNLWRDPFFLISGGLFLFFSGSVLIYIFLNFILLYSKELNDRIWAVHAFLNYLLYTIYALALWKTPRK